VTKRFNIKSTCFKIKLKFISNDYCCSSVENMVCESDNFLKSCTFDCKIFLFMRSLCQVVDIPR
jgi:hypothetical protein